MGRLHSVADPPPIPVAMEAYNLSIEEAAKSSALLRVSREVFFGDRGEMAFDGVGDAFVCHLSINADDREITHGGMLTEVEDVWLVINAHTTDEGFEIPKES